LQKGEQACINYGHDSNKYFLFEYCFAIPDADFDCLNVYLKPDENEMVKRMAEPGESVQKVKLKRNQLNAMVVSFLRQMLRNELGYSKESKGLLLT
jgi:hypothetical protein